MASGLCQILVSRKAENATCCKSFGEARPRKRRRKIQQNEMNEELNGYAAEAIESAFGERLTFNACRPAADTAFSGSAVIELSVSGRSVDNKPNSTYSTLDQTDSTLDAPTPNPSTPLNVVLKHSSVRALALDDNCSKETRDKTEKTDKSSVNECAFLQLFSPNLHPQTLPIPKTLYTRIHPTKGVTLLMSSHSSWTQLPVIPLGPRTTATIKWLANFHATFLQSIPSPLPIKKLATSGGWDSGTHLCLSKRPSSELDTLSSSLKSFASRFSSHHPYFTSPKAQSQPSRITKAALLASSYLYSPTHPHLTMVHGDYKSGNFFYDPTNPNSISVIDWQWTGPGVGSTDIIYLLVMALSNSACNNYESTVLKPYHEFLKEALPDGVEYSYEDLLIEFKLSAIDFQRWLHSSSTPSMTPESLQRSKQNVDVNHGIWRREIDRIAWLWKVVDEALDDIDNGLIKP